MTRGSVERTAFAAYAVWMAVGLALTALRIAPGAWGDFILILLAALVVYFSLALRWGDRRAVRWGVFVLIASAAVEACGTRTGFPFGLYVYTGAFGPRIGPLPLAIPLAWYAVVGGGTAVFERLPGVSRAAAVAVLAAVLDAVMEPFAVRIKGYWIWQTADGMPPWGNYLAWAALAFLLALAGPRGRAVRERRAAWVLGSIAALFIVARVCYGI